MSDRLVNEVTREIMITLPADIIVDLIKGKRRILFKKHIPQEFTTGWVNVVVGNRRPYLEKVNGKYLLKETSYNNLNGKVILKFWLKDVELVEEEIKTQLLRKEDLLKLANFTEEEYYQHKGVKDIYAWYVAEVLVFREPLELIDFKTYNDKIVEKAPKKYLSVWRTRRREILSWKKDGELQQ